MIDSFLSYGLKFLAAPLHVSLRLQKSSLVQALKGTWHASDYAQNNCGNGILVKTSLVLCSPVIHLLGVVRRGGGLPWPSV